VARLRQSTALVIARSGQSSTANSCPAIAADGSIVSCCDNRGPNVEKLVAAGLGQRLNREGS
jgi:hypothetical protein